MLRPAGLTNLQIMLISPPSFLITHNFPAPLHHSAMENSFHNHTSVDLDGDTTPPSFASTTSSPTLKLSTSTNNSESETTDSISNLPNLPYTNTIKPHSTSNHDPNWKAIRNLIHNSTSSTNFFTLQHLNFIQKLGSGDIGTVYLVELKGAAGCLFAAKVMDKEELENRNKESRANMERQVLEMLDHPFLPTLYTTLDTSRWFCLLTEFCPGGDLHILRQRQPDKRFSEAAVRFYASEVVAALEYLHMLGIIYRDLKPENVLVRSDGHIMLTDFDLCLKCDASTTSAPQILLTNNTTNIIIDSPETTTTNKTKHCPIDRKLFSKSSCILPNCVVPAVSCFRPNPNRNRRPSKRSPSGIIVAEPTDARSMSFVGTHEYLAPEIVSGEGHGSAVDWWTLGIFIYELIYGVTPFRGFDHEFTLTNIIARALDFPKDPTKMASSAAKDLITKLLIKNPGKRMGSTMGATEIKNHSFFNGVNWALLRCTTPPHTPIMPTNFKETVSSNCDYDASVEYY